MTKAIIIGAVCALIVFLTIAVVIQSAALDVERQRAKDFQAMPCGDR